MSFDFYLRDWRMDCRGRDARRDSGCSGLQVGGAAGFPWGGGGEMARGGQIWDVHCGRGDRTVSHS